MSNTVSSPAYLFHKGIDYLLRPHVMNSLNDYLWFVIIKIKTISNALTSIWDEALMELSTNRNDDTIFYSYNILSKIVQKNWSWYLELHKPESQDYKFNFCKREICLWNRYPHPFDFWYDWTLNLSARHQKCN